ncbi:hypothetical protein D3C80_2020100 [compost metagenome]
MGRSKINDTGTLKNRLFIERSQLIPERLSTQHQRNIAFPFAVGMANETGITMMAAFFMRRHMGIDHQHVKACLCGVISRRRTHGAAA